MDSRGPQAASAVAEVAALAVHASMDPTLFVTKGPSGQLKTE